MQFNEERIERVPVQLDDGTIIKVEVQKTGREDVAFEVKSFSQIANTLEEIARALTIPIQRAKPDKASVKFGMELSIESGKLTTVLVKGSSKANLEITLEWNQK